MKEYQEEELYFGDKDLIEDEYYNGIKDLIKCKYCHKILNEPMMCLKCQGTFCKKCTNELNIPITIIAISSDSNSELAHSLSIEKGCNYFTVQKDYDLENFLV